MIQLLRSRHGGGYITACIIILVIAMVLSVVLFYAHCMTILQTTKDNAELVLEGFILKNATEIYQSIKQGHDLTERFNESVFFSEFTRRFSFIARANHLYRYSENGQMLYALLMPKVSYQVEHTLKLQVQYRVMIPVRFAGKQLFSLYIPQTVTRSFTLKT